MDRAEELAPRPNLIKLPSFSIIVPTWKDVKGLERTVTNLIIQSCDDPLDLPVPRDIIIVGDGFEPAVKRFCLRIAPSLEKLQHIRLGYFALQEHVGNGNIPRNVGLSKAVNDWTVFIDAGTAVSRDFFYWLGKSIHENPSAKILTWDMFQLMDPVPVVSDSTRPFTASRANGLPYVFPGCATAVKTEYATQVQWTTFHASDWVYFSQVWEKIFGPPEQDDLIRVAKEVVAIQVCLTCAYGNRSKRKWRPPMSEEAYEESKFNMGARQALAAFKAEKNDIRTSTEGDRREGASEPVQQAEDAHSSPPLGVPTSTS